MVLELIPVLFLKIVACVVLLTYLTNSYFPPHLKDSSLEDGGGVQPQHLDPSLITLK